MSHILRNRLLALCGLILATSVGSVYAQEATTGPATTGPVQRPAMRLYHDSGSSTPSATRGARSAAELRQARAWQQHLNREARIEAAKNAGYHLSRPPAVAVPSMTSRYEYVRPRFVPVYVYPRY